MSLEATIQENTAAIRELIAKLTTGPALAGVAPATPKADKPAPDRGRASAQAGPTPEQIKAGAKPGVEPAPEAKTPAYEDVSKAVLALAKDKGRDVAVEVLSRFEHKDKPGVKADNGKNLKPADYGAFIKAAAEASVAS